MAPNRPTCSGRFMGAFNKRHGRRTRILVKALATSPDSYGRELCRIVEGAAGRVLAEVGRFDCYAWGHVERLVQSVQVTSSMLLPGLIREGETEAEACERLTQTIRGDLGQAALGLVEPEYRRAVERKLMCKPDKVNGAYVFIRGAEDAISQR